MTQQRRYKQAGKAFQVLLGFFMEEMSEYNLRSFKTYADYHWKVVLEFQFKTFQLLRVVIVAVKRLEPYYYR